MADEAGGTAAAGAGAQGGTGVTVKAGAGGNAGASASVPVTVGGAAANSQQANSAAATVQNSMGQQVDPAAAAAAGAQDFKTQLGEYGKDPAFEGFKDPQSLAKAYKDTKALVGQKLGIPAEDATPEAKSAFYKALGVPDKAEEYGLKAPENLPEAVAKFYNAEQLTEYQAKAKELNLTPVQAKGLQEWNDKNMATKLEALQTQVGTSDKEFSTQAAKIYGSDENANKALGVARAMSEKYAPEWLRKELTSMPNTALLAIAAVATGLSKEMTGEDMVIGGGGTQAAMKSVAELRNDAKAIMALPEYGSPFAKGIEVHNKTKSDLQAIYKQIEQQQAAGKKK